MLRLLRCTSKERCLFAISTCATAASRASRFFSREAPASAMPASRTSTGTPPAGSETSTQHQSTLQQKPYFSLTTYATHCWAAMVDHRSCLEARMHLRPFFDSMPHEVY